MLEDVLSEGLAVVFCGTGAGDRSGRVEAYYAARGNKFWQVLFRTKLTPRQFRPEEYGLLMAHDIGLIDLAKLRIGTESSEAKNDLNVQELKRKIADNKPTIIAFNGNEAARRCLIVETVAYGRRKSTFEGAAVYVLPSTSVMAKDHWDEQPWEALAAEVRKVRSDR